MQASVMLDSLMTDFFAYLISTAFHIEQTLSIFSLTLEHLLNPNMNFTVVTSLGTDGQANLFLLGSS
jgi:hypothetical protein